MTPSAAITRWRPPSVCTTGPDASKAPSVTLPPGSRRLQRRDRSGGRPAATAALTGGFGLGILGAAGVHVRRSRAAAAAPPRRRPWPGAADAGLGQHQLHLPRRRMVAGDLGDDRAHLLVARRHQEGRRPSVGLRADDEEARLRMRELGRAVRRHGAAGVQVRVDQRRQRRRRLDRRIERHPQLAQHAEIGPEAGRDHDPIDEQRGRLACHARGHPQTRRRSARPLRREGRQHLQPSVLDRPLCRQPQRATLR